MSNHLIQPYLFFNGRCEEALKFYEKAIGAKLEMLMRYKDCPETPKPGTVPPNYENKVMHTSFRVGSSVIMASDGCDTSPKFEGFSLSLTVPTEAEADRVFKALSEGGEVTLPLSKTFWSPKFGMLQDKFGIGWMISLPTPGAP
jgi:PhnB protein